jgi:hypothetical protein
MPEISRFFGVVIYMYFNEHNPPHFHAKYSKYRAQIAIESLAVIEGYLPPKILSLVVKWAKIHKKELFKNWSDIINNGTFTTINPLE